MHYYIFDYDRYQKGLNNFDNINWDKYAIEENNGDWGCVANPCFIENSADHHAWKQKFDIYFGKRCTFPYMQRVINAYLVENETKQLYNPLTQPRLP